MAQPLTRSFKFWIREKMNGKIFSTFILFHILTWGVNNNCFIASNREIKILDYYEILLTNDDRVEVKNWLKFDMSNQKIYMREHDWKLQVPSLISLTILLSWCYMYRWEYLQSIYFNSFSMMCMMIVGKSNKHTLREKRKKWSE